MRYSWEDTFKKTLFVIKWKSDGELEVTSGYQIEAIHHSEKKWYHGEPQMEILRKATKEDLGTMEVVLDGKNTIDQYLIQ